ncbi:MAG: metallophosphoesterase [Thermoleophilia bacterium]|nr:metallophosphoesterase [Thermoleophilia bacterium]
MTDSTDTPIGGRIAIISDIHGNRHALEAVRRAQRQAGLTRTWCLGDMVGYGAHPTECLRVCVHESERCIAGNHDLAAAGRVPSNEFSPWARTAIEWTRTRLDRNALDRLAVLEPQDVDGPVALFHASPSDPVWDYVISPEHARAAFAAWPARLMMIGHTHLAGAWRLGDDGRLDGGLVRGEETISLETGRWLMNPGSVGQPRDLDPRASWAILDLDALTLTFRRTPYDVPGAQNAIQTAGLPIELGARLAEGR